MKTVIEKYKFMIEMVVETMDNRKALSKGTILAFDGMRCRIEEEIGRGSNAIVYRGSYPDFLNQEENHVVLIKELFPFHAKAYIRRGSQNEIICEEEAKEYWKLHKDSFEYGNKIHLQMLQQYPDQIGENFNTFMLNNTNYTVLGFTGGRSLEQELSYENYSLKKLVNRMIGILDALQAFHENNLLHLDIAPDNIMLIGKGMRERVMLIDFNSTHSIESIRNENSYFSMKSGYTAHEIRSGKSHSIGFHSDLYSVTAVFYRCLSGEALTPFQMIRPTPPDVSKSPFLKDAPETVRSMVKQILLYGLSSVPKKRYASVSEMREVFEELNDRIDGIGVTHWALWEVGKKTIHRLITSNISLNYLKGEDTLFPANAVSENGTILPVNECISKLFTENGENVFLTAPGGMGKTTAMFRAMLEQSSRYSPIQPAIAYVSLYGWKENSTTYIRDRILENLHFKRDMTSYEDARHALQYLMKIPLQTQNGKKYPILVVFIDGLNEASGETQALMEEIAELSRLEGIKLLVSSRTETQIEGFQYWKLEALREEEVSQMVSSKGLLLPESKQMCELLRIPLMLSMFLEAANNKEKQICVNTQEELLQLYFDSLIEKEMRDLPENEMIRWQIDVAVSYVLPAVAAELHKKNHDLNDAQLLPVVEKCYNLFSSMLLKNAFPKWIGRSKAIFGATDNVQEWYGLIVHDILWHRLGLLVKNEQGNYQTVHQIIGEYLLEENSKNQKKIWKKQRIKFGIMTGITTVLLVSGSFIYTKYIAPQPYSENFAQSVLYMGCSAYSNVGKQYEMVRELLDCAIKNPLEYKKQLYSYTENLNYLELGFNATELSENLLNQMLSSGEVMPWSRRAFDAQNYQLLLNLAMLRDGEYEEYVNVLTYLMENETIHKRYGESYCDLFSQLIETDADISSVLFQIVCYSDITILTKESENDAVNLESVMKSNYLQNEHLPKETKVDVLLQMLTTLQGKREDICGLISSSGAYAKYRMSMEE